MQSSVTILDSCRDLAVNQSKNLRIHYQLKLTVRLDRPGEETSEWLNYETLVTTKMHSEPIIFFWTKSEESRPKFWTSKKSNQLKQEHWILPFKNADHEVFAHL